MGSANVRAPLARRDHPTTTPRDRSATEQRCNPYAAPQVIDRPVKPSALPVAEFAENDGTRQLFPEQTTAALAGMVRRTKAIDDVQIVWFLISGLLGATCGACFSKEGWLHQGTLYSGLGCALSLIRWRAGASRSNADRFFAIGMDWILFTTTLGLGVWAFASSSQGFLGTTKGGKPLGPTIKELVFLVIALPCLFFPGYFSLCSLRALFGGQLLFGPERLKHEDLVTELAYRQTHGIE